MDGTATAWNPTSDGVVSAIALSGPVVYAGGSFINIGGQQRIFLAAINAADGTATAWNPNPDSTITTIAVSGDLVYVGGMFGNVGGQPIARNEVMRGVLSSWLDSSLAFPSPSGRRCPQSG